MGNQLSYTNENLNLFTTDKRHIEACRLYTKLYHISHFKILWYIIICYHCVYTKVLDYPKIPPEQIIPASSNMNRKAV